MFALAFLCLYAIGFSISHLYLPRSGFLEKTGFGFGLGVGAVTLLIFFLLLLDFFSPSGLILSEIFVLVALGLACARRKRESTAEEQTAGFTSAEDGGENRASILPWVFIIAFLFLSGFLFSSVIPIMETDGVNYSFFGRAAAIAGNLSGLAEGLSLDSRQRTPLVQLTYAFVESMQGSLPKFAHPLFYLSFLLVFYGRAVDLGLRKKSAVLLTVLLASTPLIWWHGTLSFNNLAAGYYFSAGTFLMIGAMLKNDEAARQSQASLAGIFYALAAWARIEFLLYFMIPLFIAIRHSLKTNDYTFPFRLSIPPILLGLFWAVYIYRLFDKQTRSSVGNILVVVAIMSVLAAYAFLYKQIAADSGFGCAAGFLKILNSAEDFFCEHWITIVLAPLILIVVLGEFSVFEHAAPKINYLLVSARARFFQTLMQHGYWIFTNTLLLAFIFGFFPVTREVKYLFVILAVFVVFHNILYMIVGYSKGYGKSWLEIVKVHIFKAGNYINGSSSRELISFYPLLIFAAAMGWSVFSPANPEHQTRLRRADLFVKSAIALNLAVLIYFFWTPKAVFVGKHFGESKREFLLSEGSKDNPNYFQTANQWAYRVKDLTPENAVVILPLEHSIGPFSLADILLPRKTTWFAENTQPDPSIYVRYGDRPVYAITADGWFPLVPYEMIETFMHQEFEVSLVRILNVSGKTTVTP